MLARGAPFTGVWAYFAVSKEYDLSTVFSRKQLRFCYEEQEKKDGMAEMYFIGSFEGNSFQIRWGKRYLKGSLRLKSL